MSTQMSLSTLQRAYIYSDVMNRSFHSQPDALYLIGTVSLIVAYKVSPHLLTHRCRQIRFRLLLNSGKL